MKMILTTFGVLAALTVGGFNIAQGASATPTATTQCSPSGCGSCGANGCATCGQCG